LLLEFDPGTILLFEDNLVSKYRCFKVNDRRIPSDNDISIDESDNCRLKSVRASSGSEGERIRPFTDSTSVFATDSESVYLSFGEALERVLSFSKFADKRPLDSVGLDSLIPLDLVSVDLSIDVRSRPGQSQRSGGSAEFVNALHGGGLVLNRGAVNVSNRFS